MYMYMCNILCLYHIHYIYWISSETNVNLQLEFYFDLKLVEIPSIHFCLYATLTLQHVLSHALCSQTLGCLKCSHVTQASCRLPQKKEWQPMQVHTPKERSTRTNEKNQSFCETEILLFSIPTFMSNSLKSMHSALKQHACSEAPLTACGEIPVYTWVLR